MALNSLVAELKKRTASEVGMIERGGMEEAKRLKAEAREEAKRIIKEAGPEAEAVVERGSMQVSAARLKAKRIVQDAKYGLVSKTLGEVKKVMKGRARNRKEYEKLFEKLVRLGTSEIPSGFVLHVNAADAKLAKNFGPVALKHLSAAGGVIIASRDGSLKINNTFEALLEDREEELRQKAFELLFR